MAHMDELSMIVKRVESDGTLHMTQLGTMYPGNFGLGPVAVLGDNETLTAVLALGSEHTTQESSRIWETKPDQGDRALDWHHVYVFTGRSPEELSAAGVHAGTRVCIDRSKRSVVEIGDYVGAYFLDDRAAVTALLKAARELRERDRRPADDVYLVFTTNEEIGGVGVPTPAPPCPATSRWLWKSVPPSANTPRAWRADRSSATATRCAFTTKTSPTGCSKSPPTAGCRRSRPRLAHSNPTRRTPRPAD